MNRIFIFSFFLILQSCQNKRLPVKSESFTVLSTCAKSAFIALQKEWPSVSLNPADFQTAIEFDCKEASKIRSLNNPVITANPAMESINKLVSKLPNGFVKDSVSILRPYCRKDNEFYGPFCMAADIDSAAVISQDKDMLALIPFAVHELGSEISRHDEVNLYEILDRKAPSQLLRRSFRLALIAGFLGLDDNAVQADRLKANLIFEGRLQDYAKVFPALTQYATFPVYKSIDYSKDFLAVLYSTRTGIATLPGVKDDETQTYKAYAGFYLGCRMADLGHAQSAVETEAFNMGYGYQMTKLGMRLGKPLKELIADTKKLDSAGRRTGEKMQAGSRLGYQLCKTSSR
jgi:hypothetical protein